MRIWNSLGCAREELARAAVHTVVTIGNFDGVHLGHRAIFNRTLELAKSLNSLAVAVTFANHTESLWSKKPPLITTMAVRRALLSELAIDGLLEIEFDRNFAALEPETFFQSWLIDGLRARGLVVGYDFHFGNRARGDFDLLRRLGEAGQVRIERVPPLNIDGEAVSSSRIRELLANGRIEAANRMLGGCYRWTGTVVHGEQRGRTLGFPTANLPLDPEFMVLRFGVYLVRVRVEGMETNPDGYFGLGSVGVKPTFGHYDPLLEVYLIDFGQDLYSREVTVEFLHFIRAEIHFPNAAALVSQMRRDLETARKLLQSAHSYPTRNE